MSRVWISSVAELVLAVAFAHYDSCCQEVLTGKMTDEPKPRRGDTALQ